MTQRLSGHFSIFGLIVFVLKSLLGIVRQQGGKAVGGGGGGDISRITPIFLSYYASRKNKILTTLRSTLLSLNLTKSEVEEREKRARRWRHNYLFLMSLLLVSNDINHHENFKGISRLTRCENSHASRCYAQSRPHAANLGSITHRADNLGPITRHGKPLCHSETMES